MKNIKQEKSALPAVIIELQRRYKSFTPYWRNDRILRSLFDVPIINGRWRDYAFQDIRNIVLTYSAGWADFRQIVSFLTHHPDSQIIRFLNEYDNQKLNSSVAHIVDDAKCVFIANFPATQKFFKEYHHWNINTLIFEKEKIKRAIPEKKYNVLYYGMFRKNRLIYFKKYLDERIHVSTSRKNILLFKQAGVRPQFIKHFYWGKSSILELFRYSLYIEDIYTHSHYNFPANRFYEALMFQTVLLVDENCKNTFDKAGISVEDYIVSDGDSVRKRTKELNRHYEHHLKNQAKWRIQAEAERHEVIEKLRRFFQ
jgi:hypothetical protein